MKHEGVNLSQVPRIALKAKAAAAAALDISEWSLYREIKEGRIAKTRLNLISVEELQRYATAETEKGRASK